VFLAQRHGELAGDDLEVLLLEWMPVVRRSGRVGRQIPIERVARSVWGNGVGRDLHPCAATP
jgi:hypothetical protein